MGKLKTKKGAAKRFSVTKKGKLKYSVCGKKHLATSKQPERLRRMRKSKTVNNKPRAKYIKRMLPYS
jgi:large subunit ribosomal protein L35